MAGSKTESGPGLKVAFVSSELYPFSKTGGLADVSAALPAALVRLGCRVQVFTPLYPSARRQLGAMQAPATAMPIEQGIWVEGTRHDVVLHRISQVGLETFFVECEPFFERAGLYLDQSGAEYDDNVARFGLFCRAVLDFFLQSGEVPDVLHCNDWQSALLPVYVRSLYAQGELARLPSVLTIHNLAYQGLYPPQSLSKAGLGWELFHIDGLEFYGEINLLKGGIICADALTTVSPSYAREIQTVQFGMGLDGLLRAQRRKLSGILNGIDAQHWDPEGDPLLPAHYSSKGLAGKRECKAALQTQLGLPVRKGALLLGLVSRLDAQKGIELLLGAWPLLRELDLQLVALGSGRADLEQQLLSLASAEPDRVALNLGFDEGLAHLIYSGADALLMPSLYEPCGLNQMYAQRYGTVPIVRETGGLRDTVRNATPRRLAKGWASGFSFKAATAEKLALAIARAWRLYKRHPKQWRELQQGIMRIDHSWDRSARAYLQLYRRLLRSADKADRSAEQADA